MTRDEAKAKVAKLMALGHDTRANENEAERALRQAAWLMQQHNIEQADIEASTGQPIRFDWTEICVPQEPGRSVSNCITWIGQLALAISRFTGTLSDYHRVEPHGTCVRFRGDLVDVTYAVYLMKRTRDAVRTTTTAHRGTRKQNADFRAGMVHGLCERMRELRAETDAALHASDSTALVVIDRKALALAAHYGKQHVATRRRQGNPTDMEAGRQAGQKVGLGRPLTGPAAQRALPA